MPISRSNTVRSKSRSPAPPKSGSTPKMQPTPPFPAIGSYEARNANLKGSYSHGISLQDSPMTRRSVKGFMATDSDTSVVPTMEHHMPDFQTRDGRRNGYPEVESHLLPTLRDTIDKMTGAPSRASPRPSKSRTDLSRRDNARISPHPSSTPDPTNSRQRSRSPREKSQRHYQPDIHDVGSPYLSSNQATPTMDTNASRSKTPRPALKSALRSPLPMLNSPSSEASSSGSGSPLKTVKSLLSRKFSGNGKTKEWSEMKSPTPPVFDEHIKSQMQGRARDGFQSNIPRHRPRLYSDDSNTLSNEDSDLERRFEVLGRDRRKLTVTNGDASLSGSDSDALSIPLHSTPRSANGARNRYAPPPDDYMGFGLGLSFPTASSSHNHTDRSKRPTALRHEEVRRGAEKNLRFSLPPSESAGSSYSDDQDRPPQRDFSMHPKREFYDPGAGDRGPPQVNRRDSRDSASSYFRRSPTLNSMAPSTDDETESEREGYTIRRPRDRDKRRSMSCSPSMRHFDENERSEPPPRPNSACQRYPPKPGRPDPSTLRDLIKSRHSFTKPPQRERAEPLQTPTPGSSLKRNSSAQSKKDRGKLDSRRSSPRPEDSRSRAAPSRDRTDAAAVAENYRATAARERSAFGLPPSESDEFTQSGGLTHAESDMSSLNESIWKQEREEIETDAESLLRSVGHIVKQSEMDKEQRRQKLRDTAPRLNVVSPTLSASSINERPSENMDQDKSWQQVHYDEFDTRPWERQANANTNGKGQTDNSGSSAPTSATAEDLLSTREGVIQEIFQSEEELLRRLHICMHLFILPLRVQNSRSWIAGMPPTIARLLDWFDDIVNLHEQIYQALCSARDTMSPATDRVSESLRWFVLKVEVYQPYLVRLAEVSQEIAAIVKDPESDFGQFIRLQERSAECKGWTLEKLLMLPVNRLMAYQDLFARMLDLTPKDHQDYLSTLSLSRSTDMVVKVMTEVKIREDEYALLKAFSQRIQDLPPSSGLAVRERRLLHSGPLQLVLSNLSELTGQSFHDHRTSGSKRVSRSSRLLDAIGKPNYAAQVASGAPGTLDGNLALEKGISYIVPSASTPKASWFSRLPLRKRSRSKSPLPQDSRQFNSEGSTTHVAELSPDINLRTVDVHAFVFTDLVLLAQQRRSSGPEPSWILCEDLGLFRPMSLARIRRRHEHEGMILSLESAAFDSDHLNGAFDFRTSNFRVVDLLIPPPPAAGGPLADEDLLPKTDLFQPWLLSLRQCCNTTLRKLTFVSANLSHDGVFLGTDREFDEHLAVSSLTNSGLPLPRSPSGFFPDTAHSQDPRFESGQRGGSGDEREERGWWSLRYQQVFRELQRQDSLLFDDDEEDS